MLTKNFQESSRLKFLRRYVIQTKLNHLTTYICNFKFNLGTYLLKDEYKVINNYNDDRAKQMYGLLV